MKALSKKYISQIWLHVVWVPLFSPKKNRWEPKCPACLGPRVQFRGHDDHWGVQMTGLSGAKKRKSLNHGDLKNGWKYQRSIESLG